VSPLAVSSDPLQHCDLLREIVAATSWKIRIKARAVSLSIPYLDLDGEPMNPEGEIISKFYTKYKI
jgi:hypothetical protein